MKNKIKTYCILLFLIGYISINAQYLPSQDLDGDTIINSIDLDDLDDDNDGILDEVLCSPSFQIIE